MSDSNEKSDLLPIGQMAEEQKSVVLLVDDQKMVAEAIRRMLATESDIEFHYCADPAVAVQTAARIQPTVILQDLIMPDVDGYTLLGFYRSNPGTANVPVIVLSSRDDPMDKSQAFTNGASDYLVKLPDRIELIARIRAHSRSYLLQKQRDEAFKALEDLRRRLEESNAVLQRLSVLDGLTGVANRRHFDEVLQQEWKRASREHAPMSIILLDIDYFKKFNDNYGHQGGDDCLRRVARAISKIIKRPGDLFARYGGEEFVAVLPQTDLAGAAIIAEEMRRSVEQENIPHGHSGAADHVTISIGVATVTVSDGLEPLEAVEMADKALYMAKEQGRNRYVVYVPDAKDPQAD
ncbi:MAG: diguanylate cyclase [Pseudomonadota bacterium]